MTGCVFLSVSKYIEIGKIIASTGCQIKDGGSKPSSQCTTTAPSRGKENPLKSMMMKMNKSAASRKSVVTSSESESDSVDGGERRKIKHYSIV